MMKVVFQGFDCRVVFSRYTAGNNLAIELVEDETNEPVAYATVNIPDYQLEDDNLVAIKDYSENEGMLEALMEAGVIEKPSGIIRSGFVELFICKLTERAIQTNKEENVIDNPIIEE